MSSNSYPVTVAVRSADGSIQQVRVGTAVKSAEGFSLTLGELSIGDAPDRAAAPARRAAPAGDSGMVFPPYGRSKGAPITGASVQDLEFYANGCRRTLGDPAKSRWHEKERVLLAAIEAELARQGAGGEPAFGDADAGPAFGGGRERDFDFDGNPPHTDDDIPF